MSHYKAEPLNASKEQLVRKLELYVKRLKNNPETGLAIARKWQADVFFLKHFADEAKLPYYWTTLLEIVDDLRSWNMALGDKRLKPLLPMQEFALERKLSSVPVSELDFKKALLQEARDRMKFGSMRNG